MNKARKLLYARFGNLCSYKFSANNIGCIIMDPLMLQIDHINNDAWLDRTKSGYVRKANPAKLLKMTDKDLFAKYQLLCRNHNMKKHRLLVECSRPFNCQISKEAQKNRRAAESRRKRVYDLFGNHCAICGETDPYMFSIDHIHNDGKICRATVNRDSKRAVLKYLREYGEEFVFSRFQLACFNCNWKKELLRRQESSCKK